MQTLSLWKAISSHPIRYPSLKEEIEVDVAIVGGGITGITTALQLVNAGKKVAVIESHEIGEGTTGFSTGNLYIPIQSYYQEVEKNFNEETAKIIAHSRKYAIDFIENVVNEKKINCQFSRRPWYLYTNDENQISFLEKEVDTLKKLNCPIEYTQSLPLNFNFKKAATLNNQARFNPLQYVISLAEQLSKSGCHIFENSMVTNITEHQRCVVETEQGKVFANQVVIATHTPTGINPAQFYIAPYRSYSVAVTLEKGGYPECHLWDLNSPHHSTCTHSMKSNEPDVLIVSGNHHKVGQDSNAIKRFQQLEDFLKKEFPVKEILYRWSAQHYQTADKLPYVGLASRFAKNVYMATGFYADGLVYGTLSGITISDLILKKENKLEKAYDSNRSNLLNSIPFLFKENGNVFLQYLKDLPLPGKSEYEELKKGEGKIVEIDQKKWAVSRDQDGQLHMVSAVCTHMKCIVEWNNAESTWDCPCHGSRFTAKGKVIEGPAQAHLEKKEL